MKRVIILAIVLTSTSQAFAQYCDPDDIGCFQRDQERYWEEQREKNREWERELDRWGQRSRENSYRQEQLQMQAEMLQEMKRQNQQLKRQQGHWTSDPSLLVKPSCTSTGCFNPLDN